MSDMGANLIRQSVRGWVERHRFAAWSSRHVTADYAHRRRAMGRPLPPAADRETGARARAGRDAPAGRLACRKRSPRMEGNTDRRPRKIQESKIRTTRVFTNVDEPLISSCH